MLDRTNADRLDRHGDLIEELNRSIGVIHHLIEEQAGSIKRIEHKVKRLEREVKSDSLHD